jgi:uncharacterized membrane protein
MPGLVKAVVHSRWFHPLLLLVWILVGAGLRLMRVTAEAPWTDEFATIVFSLGHSFRGVPLDRAIALDVLLQPLQPDPATGVGEVIHYLLKESNHPPLYFVLAHLWMSLFPPEGGLVSLWAARSLPAFLGIASIPAMFGLGYVAFRSRLVAQMTAAMMAISPYGVFLAQGARHYTLAILLAIASLCCLVSATRAIHHRTHLPLWMGLTWVGINTLGVATHYFFTLTLCAEALVLLVLAWRYSKKEREQDRSLFSPRLFSQNQTQLKPQFSSKPWKRLFLIAAGTLTGSLVWLPVVQANHASDSKLTDWIYDGDPLESFIEPIGRVLAWGVTILVSLPMELTTLPLAIVIASGIGTVIFLFWALPILSQGLKLQKSQLDSHLSVQVLSTFIIGSLVLFFLITYGLRADLTLAPRYQFVYFPAAIALLGGILATLWDTSQYFLDKADLTPLAPLPYKGKGETTSPLHPSHSPLLGERTEDETFYSREGLGERYPLKYWETSIPALETESTPAEGKLPVVRPFRRGDKKAVIVIWLVGLVGGLTVAGNFSYLQNLRSDLLVGIIQKTSNSPVLIATTHKHHGQTGRMMGLAWEFKRTNRSGSPTSGGTASPQFLLASKNQNSPTYQNPTLTLQEAVAGLPRPLDVWLVNFHAGVDLQQQNCFAASESLPKLDSYRYRLYRCPAPN